MDLSIIIVNWNSAALLKKCLASVYAGAQEIECEVIVVDNASFDHAGEMVRTEFPGVKFVQSATNLGFAKANNIGVKSARGRNLLFLNPDTENVGDALGQMSRFLDATPDAAIVGCKILNSDMSLQTSCVQSFPSILNQALDAEALRRAFPSSRFWGMQALVKTGSEPTSVDVISGACLMIKSDVFAAIGQFTPNYFMYAEDADLCFKSRKAGFRNYYLAAVSVVHHGGGSSSAANNFASVMMRESLLEFMRIRRGRVYAAGYQCSTLLMAAFRLLLLAVALPFTTRGDKREVLRRASAKWFSILRWGLGMESWARQLASVR